MRRLTVLPGVPRALRLPPRQVLFAALVYGAMMAGHTALETARDALFLARLSVAELPWTYAAIAVAALLATELNGRLRARYALRHVLTITLWCSVGGSLAFLLWFERIGDLGPHAFYVWVAVIATLATAQFWLLVSEQFTVIEAKSAFAWITSLGMLGALLGGALAGTSAARFGNFGALVAGAALFALAAVLPALTSVFRPAPSRSLRGAYDSPSDARRRPVPRDRASERYLQRVLLLALLATIVATLTDYAFKAEVASHVPASELGSFFGRYNVGLSAFALIVQVLVAPRVLRSTSVGRSLAVVPTTLSLAAALSLLVPGFFSIVALRGLDASLRHSVHRGTLEVLYMPLSSRVRARWKLLVDVLAQRGGQALAAVLIFSAIQVHCTPAEVVAGVLFLSLAWLLLAVTLERGYVALFRAKVKSGALETRAEVPALDMRSLESLVAALGSGNDEEVLAAIHLLRDYERVRAIPALLLYHPSKRVLLAALDVFTAAERVDFVDGARRLLQHEDEEVRAAAMIALAAQTREQDLRAELARPAGSLAHAAALVAVVVRGLDADGSAVRQLERVCGPDTALETRRALARALRLLGDERTAACVLRLLEGATPELELEVTQAMLARPDERFVPALVKLLGSRRARWVARDALRALGKPAFAALARALADSRTPRRLRAHVPNSLAHFQTHEAADLLLDRLDQERDGWVRFKIVRALGRLREQLRGRARRERVLAHARQNLVLATRILGLRLDLELALAASPQLRSRGAELLVAAMRDKEERAIDRGVRMLGLSHAPNVIHSIRQALSRRDPRQRADSTELLVHRAPADLAAALVALLDVEDGAERAQKAHEALGLPIAPRTHQACLSQLYGERSSTLRALAVYHARELGIAADVQRFASEAPPSIWQEVLGPVDEPRVSAVSFTDLQAILDGRGPS